MTSARTAFQGREAQTAASAADMPAAPAAHAHDAGAITGDAPVASASETGPMDAAAVLQAGRKALIPLLEGGHKPGGLPFERLFSRLLDDYFCNRLGEAGCRARSGDTQTSALCDRIALVAVGGYGRQELCLGSDIDILILCGRNLPPGAIDLAQWLFLPLWDQGYALGHGFRTVSECAKLAAHDHKVLASLLDARLVAGDPAIFRDLMIRLDTKVLPRRATSFLGWLDAEYDRRLGAHGDGAVLLEPNLKEGLGGLRDYHRILWVARLRSSAGTVEQIMARAGFSDADAQLLRESVAFLHEVRNRLHLMVRRKTDQLYLDHQPAIAAGMGFTDTEELMAVECFLGRLHRCMSDIKALSAAYRGERGGPVVPEEPCPELDGGIVMSGATLHLCLPEEVEASPRMVLDAFVHAATAQQGTVPVPDWNTRRRMAHAVENGAEALPPDVVGQALLAILGSGRASVVLEQMDGVGLLPRLLPRYGAARDRVQFDGFHTYPVGMHTLMTIRHLEGLEHEGIPLVSQLWREETDRTTVLLAALLHDLGKGEEDGSRHDERGALMAQEMLSQWGIDDDMVADVVFLVQHHLLLMRTAQRRDLNDESVVAMVAGIVGSPRMLNLLLLLTYGDAMATGPKAWNGWVASLLGELRAKVENLLRDGTLGGAGSVQSLLEARERIREHLVHTRARLPFSPEKLEALLEAMPARYLLAMEPLAVVRHLQLVHRLHADVEDALRRLDPSRAERGVIVVEGRPLDPNNPHEPWELCVAARDQRGLFTTVAGVLALHGLNVFAAEAYVWREGTVFDIFHVSPPPDPLYARDFWGKVRGAMHFALTGKLSLDYRIENARQAGKLPQVMPDVLRDAARRPDEVRMDNALSDFHTVIEVFATDRPALLYDIARVLQTMQLDLLFARISTLGNRTADSFSVRTLHGEKIVDPDHMAEVRAALLHAVSRREGRG